MYFLNCINSYKRIPIQDFKGRGEIYILPELIKRDYERWLDEQVAYTTVIIIDCDSLFVVCDN